MAQNRCTGIKSTSYEVHSQLLYSNLEVLCALHPSLSSDALKKTLNENMFKVSNREGFYQVLYFLLKAIDAGKQKLKIVWPIFDSKAGAEFFDKARSYLQYLKEVSPYYDIPNLSPSFCTTPSGDRLTHFFLKLSIFTMTSSLGEWTAGCDSVVPPPSLHPGEKMWKVRIISLEKRSVVEAQACTTQDAFIERLCTVGKEQAMLMEAELTTISKRELEIAARIADAVNDAQVIDPEVPDSLVDVENQQSLVDWKNRVLAKEKLSQELLDSLHILDRGIELNVNIIKRGILPKVAVLDGSDLKISPLTFSDEMEKIAPGIQALASTLYVENKIVLPSLFSLIKLVLQSIGSYYTSMQDFTLPHSMSTVKQLSEDAIQYSCSASEMKERIIDLFKKFDNLPELPPLDASMEALLQDSSLLMIQSFNLNLNDSSKISAKPNFLTLVENNLSFDSARHKRFEKLRSNRRSNGNPGANDSSVTISHMSTPVQWSSKKTHIANYQILSTPQESPSTVKPEIKTPPTFDLFSPVNEVTDMSLLMSLNSESPNSTLPFGNNFVSDEVWTSPKNVNIPPAVKMEFLNSPIADNKIEDVSFVHWDNSYISEVESINVSDEFDHGSPEKPMEVENQVGVPSNVVPVQIKSEALKIKDEIVVNENDITIQNEPKLKFSGRQSIDAIISRYYANRNKK